jgi:regulator of cell morphogenesis and NO signaling
MIDVQATLGELVTTTPALAVELVRRGLDPCCGGHRRFVDACEEAGLDPGLVSAELTAVEPPPTPPAWATMGLVQLVDHVETTHHRYLQTELPRLDDLGATVLRVHGARHRELADVRRLVSALRLDLMAHLAKEEHVLFPAIRQLAVAEHAGDRWLQAPIATMRHEHDRAGHLLAELRAATGGYEPPDDACASYQALYVGLAAVEDDTHLHVHNENNLLFPAVLRAEQRLVEGSA